jgi:hypothetical protein
VSEESGWLVTVPINPIRFSDIPGGFSSASAANTGIAASCLDIGVDQILLSGDHDLRLVVLSLEPSLVTEEMSSEVRQWTAEALNRIGRALEVKLVASAPINAMWHRAEA